MPFIQQEKRPFTREGIEWLKPNQIGVYGIFNASGCIYVGKGDIRDRLLSHFNGDNPCILRFRPTYYLAEVLPNPDAREKQLIIEYNPPCNQRVG